MKKNLKSVWAILAGFLTVFVLSVVTDLILETLKIFPPQTHPEATVWWMLLLALLYRSLYAVLGGYIAAKLAPDRPMRHAIILGIIGTVAATLGLVANVGKSDLWYPAALVILTLPSLWLGGKLAMNQQKSK